MITLFKLGYFGNRLPPSFSFVVQSPNLKCLAQNLSKALNFDHVITITCDVIKQFDIVGGQYSKFYVLSDLGEIWRMGQFLGADFEFEQKNKIQIQFEREKCHLFRKSENFGQDL